MKVLQCEMCGSRDLIKQGGVFVCQSCGTKYSVEEAKKMMVEGTVSIAGTVSVEGTVKVDQSEDLNNLYMLARRAREMDNDDNACKYYNEIILKDPNSWEANFYLVYYRASGCKKGEVGSESYNVAKCLPSTIDLLIQSQGKGEETKKIVAGIQKDLSAIIPSMVYSLIDVNECHYVGRVIGMMVSLGDALAKYDDLHEQALEAWKAAIQHYYEDACFSDKSSRHDEFYGFDADSVIAKIVEFDPTYVSPFGKIKVQPAKVDQSQPNDQSASDDKSNIVFNIISFVWPIVGLILWAVWRKDKPNKAHSVAIWALVGFVLASLTIFIASMQ